MNIRTAILTVADIFSCLTLTTQEPTRPQPPAAASPEVESYQRLKSGFDSFDAFNAARRVPQVALLDTLTGQRQIVTAEPRAEAGHCYEREAANRLNQKP